MGGGGIVDAQTMKTMNTFIQDHEKILHAKPQAQAKKPMDYTAKFNVDSLDNFNGDPEKFEDWQSKTFNTINQTILRKFLSTPLDPAKPAELTRDEDLFYAIKQVVEPGTAFHVVEKLKDSDKSGYIVWNKLKGWC